MIWVVINDKILKLEKWLYHDLQLYWEIWNKYMYKYAFLDIKYMRIFLVSLHYICIYVHINIYSHNTYINIYLKENSFSLRIFLSLYYISSDLKFV